MANKDKKSMVDEKLPSSLDHMVNDDDDIVTLIAADGKEIDFVEIAGIAYRGGFYAVLQPVELLEGMNEDEALVFKVVKGKNGDDSFEIELDEAIIDAVFTEYQKLLEEAGPDGDDDAE